MSHLFSAANNLTHPRYKHCKSWLELVFLRSLIRERWRWGNSLAAENKKCDAEIWSDINIMNFDADVVKQTLTTLVYNSEWTLC